MYGGAHADVAVGRSRREDARVTDFLPYIEGWRLRARQEEEARAAAQADAWVRARRAADRLRGAGADRVAVFGSLARGRFTPGVSDIDLAVEGLPEALYLSLWGDLLDAPGPTIDLVRIESAPASLRQAITREGRAP